MKQIRWSAGGIALACVILAAGLSCRQSSRTYTAGDFQSVRKIDAHVHDNSPSTAFADVARECGFSILSINVDYPDFPPMGDQQEVGKAHHTTYPSEEAWATTFSMTGWGQPGWVGATIAHLDSALHDGAVAVKFWKNIGMVFRNAEGKLVMIDDPGLDTIFSYLIARGVPIVCHCGEPRDCWLPVPEMMSNDMKAYFSHHPLYHMYEHPEMPSYEAQIAARNHRLERSPGMKFMGAHLGSIEWNVDTLASFLDRFPTASVDLAARIDYLQVQSQRDREKVREFFVKYADRLIYATDLVFNPPDDPAAFKTVTADKWRSDWAYLATDSVMTQPLVSGTFQGLCLEKPVIEKVYHENAERLFSGAWKKPG
ncbi:MAG TPA: amidohydrolase family protein [Bacteroidota bacterium]|nr:amidohydrolase family protein [Bacteroidota bacterium]